MSPGQLSTLSGAKRAGKELLSDEILKRSQYTIYKKRPLSARKAEKRSIFNKMVGGTGFEPVTSSASGKRSSTELTTQR